MIVKGGDVEQLITTPYAQPYVQIVSPHPRTGKTMELTEVNTVLQRDAKHVC